MPYQCFTEPDSNPDPILATLSIVKCTNKSAHLFWSEGPSLVPAFSNSFLSFYKLVTYVLSLGFSVQILLYQPTKIESYFIALDRISLSRGYFTEASYDILRMRYGLRVAQLYILLRAELDDGMKTRQKMDQAVF